MKKRRREGEKEEERRETVEGERESVCDIEIK